MADYPRSLEEKRIVERAMASPNPTVFAGRELVIGDVPYTSMIDACRYYCERTEADESGESGQAHPALVLEATLAGRVPAAALEGKRTVLYRTVEDERGALVRMQRFAGEVLEAKEGAVSTSVLASSPGYWLGELAYGEDTTYPGSEPGVALLDVAGRNRRYERIRIDRVPEPVFTRADADRLAAAAKLADAAEEIRKESGLVLWDDAFMGARGIVPPILDSPGAEPVAWYEVGVHIDEEEFEAASKFDKRYSDVWVTRSEDDGTTTTLALLPITYADGWTAPGFVPYEIPVSDGTSSAIVAAFSRAVRAVREITYGHENVGFTTQFADPRWTRGDVVGVIEPVRLGDRIIGEKRRLVLVEGFSEDTEAEKKRYDGTGLLLSRGGVISPEPVEVLSGAMSRGVVRV